MARVKLSEYRAKRILIGESYTGVPMYSSKDRIPEGQWVAKVDQGIKKRYKRGLVLVGGSVDAIRASVASWEQQGFSQFILDPVVSHTDSEERYLSLELTRNGIRLLYSASGGVDIEEHPEKVKNTIVQKGDSLASVAKDSGIPEEFLHKVKNTFCSNHFSFLEINPLIVKESGDVHILDAAVLVDTAGEFFAGGAWSSADVISSSARNAAERAVEALDATTPASLKLSVIHPDGALFLLLSGGGGSVVIADQAHVRGAGNLLANYGEYSGGPSREETYLYTREILSLLRASRSKKKALVIAGGIANFTDVQKTFLGIIDALSEVATELRSQGVRVFVRRGGPNEARGLQSMRTFLEKEGMLGSLYGSDSPITSAIDDAITFVST